ncbi:hypothetical protein [Streptomyces sp. MA5143a]|uniref:hypothetical protein n=1 Tax=Streptomyces sp. MA5143a TaxID=2083010 RepID=UPI002158EE9C|nr:hypothetical protein [Streptomyces sp. MA5143a]
MDGRGRPGAVNYLVGLDEDRYRIREEVGIETCRAGALVLVGHPAPHPEVPEGRAGWPAEVLGAVRELLPLPPEL